MGLNPPILLTSYTPDDQERLERFFQDAWRESRFRLDLTGAHADLRRIPTEYQSGGGGFWLLRLDDEVIGTVGVRRLADQIAEVKRLNVLPQHRGQGFGERLLRHAVAHAAGARFAAVRLDTVRNPGPALRLFAKCGFVEVARYNDNPNADMFLELRLST